jgi:hypothetical protein
MTWLHAQKRHGQLELGGFRNVVATAIDGVVKRAETMACKVEREQVCSLEMEYQCIRTHDQIVGDGERPERPRPSRENCHEPHLDRHQSLLSK